MTVRGILSAVASRLRGDGFLGVRFALNVALASALLWALLRAVDDRSPIWAIASMIASSDPVWQNATRTFRARMVNASIGAAVGLFFLLIGSPSPGMWRLPAAMAVTVLLSTYVVRVPTMWRQAPITAAIVLASGISHASKKVGLESGLHKVAEVLVGCLMGLLVSWAMAKVWPVHVPEETPATAPGAPAGR